VKKLKDLEVGAFFIFYPIPDITIEKGYPVQLLQLVIIEEMDLNKPLPFPKGIRERELIRQIRDGQLESEVIEIVMS
jgi:hypothetical protein